MRRGGRGSHHGSVYCHFRFRRLLYVLICDFSFGKFARNKDLHIAHLSADRLADGGTPRSGIERRMKELLTTGDREIGMAWVRSHIGIAGNEKADRRAALERLRGEARRPPPITTFEGLREHRKAIRKAARFEPGFGRNRTDWGKHALAAYTWARTNKGPFKAWLTHLGKADDASCRCGHPTQDGDHVTFHCPLLAEARGRLLPEVPTWESLDDPHWVTEATEAGGEQEKTEGTEAFFQDLYWWLKRDTELEQGREGSE